MNIKISTTNSKLGYQIPVSHCFHNAVAERMRLAQRVAMVRKAISPIRQYKRRNDTIMTATRKTATRTSTRLYHT